VTEYPIYRAESALKVCPAAGREASSKVNAKSRNPHKIPAATAKAFRFR